MRSGSVANYRQRSGGGVGGGGMISGKILQSGGAGGEKICRSNRPSRRDVSNIGQVAGKISVAMNGKKLRGRSSAKTEIIWRSKISGGVAVGK